MELTRFYSTLRLWWGVPAALVVVAVFGAFVYAQAYAQDEAQATVAVLDPLTAKPGAYGQAQVTFDSVVHSSELAQRVGTKLGRDPDWVRGHLWVTVLPTLAGNNASPVYAVRGQDSTMDGAIKLTDTAANEARNLFIEVNTPDPAAVDAALQSAVADAQARLGQAADALNTFVAANSAHDLTVRIGIERSLVSSLELGVIQAQADSAAARAGGDYAGYVAARQRASSLQDAASREQKKLDRMTSIEDQYNALVQQVSLANAQLVQLDNYRESLTTAQALPLAGEVRIVDHAQPQPHGLSTALLYSIAVVLAVLIGLTAVYVIGLVKPPAQTAEDVATALDAQVLARIPRAHA